jgi:hypothetical protein
LPDERTGPNLTLIKGTREGADFGLAPLGFEENDWGTRTVERSLSRRPGDHVELWTFGNSATLEPIRRAARKRGLNADTAIALVVERRLVLRDLQRLGGDHTEEIVDGCGSKAKPTSELWSAHNAYLRHLLYGDDLERNSKVPLCSPRAALPIRLVDRLNGCDVFNSTATSTAELERAIEWEMAALYRGELMGEWAYRCALGALLPA